MAQDRSIQIDLSCPIKRPGLLERQRSGRDQRLDRVKETADRMSRGGSTKIIGGDVQIDLGTSDETMTKQIANRDKTDAGANQMCGEGVSDAMR